MKFGIIVVIVLNMCFSLGKLYAQGANSQHTTSEKTKATNLINPKNQHNIKFFFELDRYEFVESFSSNEEQLRQLDKIMAEEHVLVGVDSLVLVATASIDGNEYKNGILAANRANTVKELLLSRYPKITPGLVRTQCTAEDWAGLRAMVVADDHVPYKTEVLKIIDSDREADNKGWLLKSMHNGDCWKYLLTHILPKNRYGASVVFFYNIKKKKRIEYVRDTVIILDTLRFVDTVRVNMNTRKFRRRYDVTQIERTE